MSIFDVGANVGLYSVMLSRKVGDKGKIYSFEPYPVIAKYLYENISLNEKKNVTVFDTALSNFISKSSFFVFPEGQDVYNSLGAKERDVESITATKEIEVDVTTVDDFCKKNKVEIIDFMKIDVEGNEENVLLGAEEQLKKIRK